MGPIADAAALRERFSALVTGDLIVFPVRHHSPACALHVARLIDQRTPSVVLVEGPRSFSPLVPLLTHADTEAPVAVYVYAVLDGEGGMPERRRAAYYPFCDYSPELVALREAQTRGIPARFIDLDFTEQILLDRTAAEDDDRQSLLDERHYRRSRYLQTLAERLHCRDHDDLWEHLFELDAEHTSLEAFVAQVAMYCHVARDEASDTDLTADGTRQREAEMAFHVRGALQERQAHDGPVLVVGGGFHAVALPELLRSDIARPDIARGAVREQAHSLIRYSFDRLERLNGYAAGMTSPAWHQDVWQRMGAHLRAGVNTRRVRRDAALRALFDVAGELRERHRLPVPVPALAAAYEQALRLAGLRDRSAPLRTDVLDAITSCFVKGAADADGALVLGVARHVLTGSALGKVPAGAGTPPLVTDFAVRARRQRLKVHDTEPRRCVLDIYRRPDHRVTSRLLHGMTHLGVPFARRSAGPDFVNGTGLDRLQEHWEYQYSPLIEGLLVEASVYGVTVPLAVANRFVAQLEKQEHEGLARDASAAASNLVQACVLGLHDHLPRTLATLRGAVGEDATFERVASATRTLGLLWESREPLEARDIAELPALLQTAYERAVFLARDLKGADGDRAASCVSALKALRELLVSASGRHLDATLYWDTIGALHAGNDSAMLRGAAAGLLYSSGRLTEEQLGVELHGHLTGMVQPRDAVAYLRGLTQTAREVTWQQPELLRVLDALLLNWSEDEFVSTLPDLRLAFAEMTPRETDRIAEAVAEMHGLSDIGRLIQYDVAEHEVMAHLSLSRVAIEIMAADGLDGWVPGAS